MLRSEHSAYAVKATRALGGSPFEGFERGLERIAQWTDRNSDGVEYRSDPGFEAALHSRLGASWPCPECQEFDELWPNLIASLRERALEVGRGSYGGWDDADPGLARSVWCSCRHLRPEVVVETGVARGLTTHVVLEALCRNGRGRLWSIDLPPLIDQQLAGQTGAAVPPRLRERWTLLRGSSRRVLPSLIAGLGQLELPVDLFVHDSLHTRRNVRFELDCVWPALAKDAVVIVDDVQQSAAFGAFAAAHASATVLVADADDGLAQFGCLLPATR